MHILALRVSDVSDFALAVFSPHLEGQVHIAVVFRVGIDEPGLLDRFDQFDGLRHSLAREHLAHDVLSGAEAADGEVACSGRVVREDDRVHVIR